MIRRGAACAALAVLGGLLGVLGAFVQAQRLVLEVPWGVLVIPWGVVLAWVALVAAIRGGAWAVRTRWGAWSVMVGWIVATFVFAAESPSGDLALSGDLRPVVYLFGGVVLGAAAATLRVPVAGGGSAA